MFDAPRVRKSSLTLAPRPHSVQHLRSFGDSTALPAALPKRARYRTAPRPVAENLSEQGHERRHRPTTMGYSPLGRRICLTKGPAQVITEEQRVVAEPVRPTGVANDPPLRHAITNQLRSIRPNQHQHTPKPCCPSPIGHILQRFQYLGAINLRNALLKSVQSAKSFRKNTRRPAQRINLQPGIIRQHEIREIVPKPDLRLLPFLREIIFFSVRSPEESRVPLD